jgi:hypothetical protein
MDLIHTIRTLRAANDLGSSVVCRHSGIGSQSANSCRTSKLEYRTGLLDGL